MLSKRVRTLSGHDWLRSGFNKAQDIGGRSGACQGCFRSGLCNISEGLSGKIDRDGDSGHAANVATCRPIITSVKQTIQFPSRVAATASSLYWEYLLCQSGGERQAGQDDDLGKMHHEM